MQKLKIAICDDEIMLLPQLASMIKKLFLTAGYDASPVTFSSSAELLSQLHTAEPYNIYFLDIDIPELNGIILAEKIKNKSSNSLIIFVSAKEELVYETFRVQPTAFVRKSHFSDDMHLAMNLLLKQLSRPKDIIAAFTDELGHELSINISQTMYIEAKEKYQSIVGTNGTTMVRCAISDLENTLKPYHFIRIHRSFLVNFQFIYRIGIKDIVLDSGKRLPLSRHRKKEVQHLFLEYAKKHK